MELFNLVMVMLGVILLSSLISNLFNKISTPLIQILLGVIVASLLNLNMDLNFDPELFLVLFIAPLLFNEANHINKLEFWTNRGMIISLALGLVIATVFVVGFVLNLLEPSIPLAAAFALGAALGPTDAVAVTSMGDSANISKKAKSILAGECLINDASGLVSFQFAIAAAVTGSFSLIEALEEFSFDFFGGIIFGILIGILLRGFLNFIKNKGFEDRLFNILFEIFIPFILYFISEFFEVSGILAVVACGIVFSLTKSRENSEDSKTNLISSNIWEMVVYVLNGMVFTLLGLMLPGSMWKIAENEIAELNFELFIDAFIIALVVIGMRFIWTLIVERIFGSAEEINKGLVKHSAVLAFTGAKGAVTLSIMLSMTYAIQARSDLIFIASIVILLTLILANFIVPVLCPADIETEEEKRKREAKVAIRVMRIASEKLVEDLDSIEDKSEQLAYQSVIDSYAKQIEETKISINLGQENFNEDYVGLKLLALQWQIDYVKNDIYGKYPKNITKEYITSCEDQQERLEQGKKIALTFHSLIRKVHVINSRMFKVLGLNKVFNFAENRMEFNRLVKDVESHILELLITKQTNGELKFKPEIIASLISEYQKNILTIDTDYLSVSQFIKSNTFENKIRLKALNYELNALDDMYMNKDINRELMGKFKRKIASQQIDLTE